MNRSAAVARIQRGLGFRSDRSSEIVSALQEAQRNLEMGKTLPNFLLVEAAPLSLVAGTQDVALPSDFLRRAVNEPNIYFTPEYGDISVQIPWRDYQDAYAHFDGYDYGGPRIAILRSSTINFIPLADQTYALYWNYYKRGASLAADIENEWLMDVNMPEALIGTAGSILASDLRDAEAKALFEGMASRARNALLSETVLRDQETGPMYMGVEN